MAYRGTVVLTSNNKTEKPNDYFVSKESGFGFGLGFGIEKHFTGTERLSPYVGGDVLLGFSNASKKETTTIANTTTVSQVKGPNDFMFGIRGVFGADYYFAKRIFLGVEAGLGLIYKSEGDITTSVTGQDDVVVKGGSTFKISPTVVTGIRLGYAF